MKIDKMISHFTKDEIEIIAPNFTLWRRAGLNNMPLK